MKRIISYLLFSLCCIIALGANAAERKITGVVIAGDYKEPLIGASVFVSSEILKKAGSSQTTLGVITDMDGKFTINVPDGVTTLQCSYVGYESQTIHLVAGKSSYEIVLQPSAHMLDAVVVTGYQTIERRKLTAAVTKLDITDDKIGSVMSIDQALSGQVAGLSSIASSGAPGAAPKIRIRGTASLNGTQDPLWVLDGVPMTGTEIPTMEDLKDIDNIYQSAIAGLNPADIESITVLKDAAATAIYGARAANGVIVITTKNGKAGKPQITFSTKLSYSPKFDIDRLNLLNSDEKVNLELGLLQSDYTFRENKGDVAGIISRYGLTDAYKAGGWNALSTAAQNEITNLRGINTDWNDILFRGTFNQEYNASLSGGSEKATYYTSLGYYDEKGNVKGVEANRLSLVLKTSYKVNKILKVGASLFANRRTNKSNLTDADGFTNPVYYSRRANPYQLPFDENGNYIYDMNVQGKGEAGMKFNVFEERDNTSYEQTTNALSAIFDVELRFNDKFKATSQVGLQLDAVSKESVADHDTYAMRKDKEFTSMWIGNEYKSFLPDGGKHTEAANTNSQVNWKAQAEYRDSYNDIHEFEMMVGTEIRKTWYSSLNSTGYGYDRKTLTTKPVIFPNESWARSYPLHTKTYVENAYASFFSTASYSLLQRYTVGGSVRFDGSDIFGVSKKYRFLPLYSFSGLWRISNEPFMKNFKRIDNLVIRASYGIQGNIDKNTSSYVMGTYKNISMLPGVTEELISLDSPPNKRLRWEKTKTMNFGTDIALFNNALNVAVDYYRRKGTDLIAMQMLPLETGFISTTVNWASMRNDGFEVALTTRNINRNGFTWFTNFNLGYNQNKVLRESVPANQTTPGREGYPVGAIFAYKSAGLDDEGYPLFYNKEGEKVTSLELLKLNSAGASTLSAEEQRSLYSYIGSSDPLFSGGFVNTFNIKRFEVVVNFIFNLKMYSRVSPSYSLTQFDRGMNTNRDILNRWTPTNTNTNLPALLSDTKRKAEYSNYDLFTTYQMMDTWVKRSDHVRLQNIRVGYKLPETFIHTLGIRSATVALEGRNLFVFGANYKNFLDPETMSNQFAQPIPKSFTFSLNMNF
ncbi:MAG: SusC/RagA family TonB-linked outer membrane protein [Bacteroides nordii]